MSASGILVVDKPVGITSHQVVARARRALGLRKVGHAGTLDPLATGVLVLGVGRGTRLLGHLTLADKSYQATIRLGQETVTDDAEGEVVSGRGAAGLTRALVEEAVAAFRGGITQVPSAVSAIKVDGVRSYARVRRGEDVELAGRTVTVGRFDVLALRTATAAGLPVLDVDVVVDCSSGTYIRALARDVGRLLGAGGHLTALRRTRVGPFSLAEAAWDAVLPPVGADPRLPLPLTPLVDVARRCFPVVEVSGGEARDVGFGRPLRREAPGPVTAIVHDGVLLALYRPDAVGSVPIAVFS